jgi:conjugal transfer ATP-binding protein TraC
MCLLSQKSSSIERLKENKRLAMDASLEAALKSLRTRSGEYSEVLIYNTQDGYATLQLHLDPFSGLLYSTKAADYERVKHYRALGFSMADALDRVLSERGSSTNKEAHETAGKEALKEAEEVANREANAKETTERLSA